MLVLENIIRSFFQHHIALHLDRLAVKRDITFFLINVLFIDEDSARQPIARTSKYPTYWSRHSLPSFSASFYAMIYRYLIFITSCSVWWHSRCRRVSMYASKLPFSTTWMNMLLIFNLSVTRIEMKGWCASKHNRVQFSKLRVGHFITRKLQISVRYSLHHTTTYSLFVALLDWICSFVTKKRLSC